MFLPLPCFLVCVLMLGRVSENALRQSLGREEVPQLNHSATRDERESERQNDAAVQVSEQASKKKEQ